MPDPVSKIRLRTNDYHNLNVLRSTQYRAHDQRVRDAETSPLRRDYLLADRTAVLETHGFEEYPAHRIAEPYNVNVPIFVVVLAQYEKLWPRFATNPRAKILEHRLFGETKQVRIPLRTGSSTLYETRSRVPNTVISLVEMRQALPQRGVRDRADQDQHRRCGVSTYAAPDPPGAAPVVPEYPGSAPRLDSERARDAPGDYRGVWNDALRCMEALLCLEEPAPAMISLRLPVLASERARPNPRFLRRAHASPLSRAGSACSFRRTESSEPCVS